MRRRYYWRRSASAWWRRPSSSSLWVFSHIILIYMMMMISITMIYLWYCLRLWTLHTRFPPYELNSSPVIFSVDADGPSGEAAATDHLECGHHARAAADLPLLPLRYTPYLVLSSPSVTESCSRFSFCDRLFFFSFSLFLPNIWNWLGITCCGNWCPKA